MTAPLHGPETTFGKNEKAKHGGRQSMQTEPDHKPRYHSAHSLVVLGGQT